MPEDTLDPTAIRLQADLLRLGHALAERRDGTHGDERTEKQAEIEVLERQLLLAIRIEPDRKLFGIQGNFSTPSDIVRVRGAALIGWEMVAECDPATRIEQVSRAIADPSQPHYREILIVRDALARAVIDGVFLLSADNNGSWGGRLLMPPSFFSWLNGKSKGDFSPKKIAAGRHQRARTSVGDETDDLLPAPLTARQIADRIAARVVGMDAGGQLAVVSGRLAMHMRRAKMLAAGQDPGTPNEVVLVLGESGTGKTWLCEQAGISTGLPQASTNTAEMSASGYVGLSVEDGLRGLYLASKCRPEVCRFGIMTYDEVTKKAGSQNESPVNSTSVLNELLRLVQGQEHTQVGGKKGNGGNELSFTVNTYGMFFFLCGHAPGLDHLIERKLGGKSIGFGSGKSRSGTRGILLDCLEDYGLPAELLNRLTAIVSTPTPSIQSLCKAATGPKGVIQSYARLLGNGDFRFQDKAVVEMAEHCRATRLYYRGLASIVSALAAEALSSERRGSVIVTPADIRRAVAGMDDGVMNLLQKTGRRDVVEAVPEDNIECDVDLATA